MTQEPKVVPPQWSVFQLQFIPYVWGGTDPRIGLDCFTLYNYTLYKSKGLILPGFDWLRGDYITHDLSPDNWVDTQADALFGVTGNEGIIGEPLHLHIINWLNRYGVGTVVKYMGSKYLVITGKNGSRVVPYTKYKTKIVRAYTPYNIAIPVNDFYGKKL